MTLTTFFPSASESFVSYFIQGHLYEKIVVSCHVLRVKKRGNSQQLALRWTRAKLLFRFVLSTISNLSDLKQNGHASQR